MKNGAFICLWLCGFLLFSCNEAGKNDPHKSVQPLDIGNKKPSRSDWQTFFRNENGRSMEDRKEELDSLLSKVQGDSLAFAAGMQILERPLSDPNSPYRNDELYAEVLSARLASRWYTELEKSVFRDRLALILQNRVGEQANDFSYWLADGERKNLYGLRSPFVLLYFYNPECEACKEMKRALLGSAYLMNAVKEGRLALLTVYTDKDLALWRRHLEEYPKDWIMGRDNEDFIYKYGVYDVRAIPSMYLLDSDKKVLLKDAGTVEELEAMLKEKS